MVYLPQNLTPLNSFIAMTREKVKKYLRTFPEVFLDMGVVYDRINSKNNPSSQINSRISLP